jgi:outer membrane protein assembly factor BamD
LEKSIFRPLSGRFFYSFALAATLIITGCSSAKKKGDPQAKCGPDFEKLHQKFEAGKYVTVRDRFTDFLSDCAGTEYVEQAHYEIAESYFRLEDWSAAEQEFQYFLKEFPNSKQYLEAARLRIAQSKSKQTLIPQRDQSKTLDAISELETFLADFPEHAYADTAQIELDRLKSLLAEKDRQIARLYEKMGEPLAAVIYYKHLLKEYGDRVPKREITLDMVACYIRLHQFTEAESILEQFDGVAKDDPLKSRILSLHKELQTVRDRIAREKREIKAAAEKSDPL